MASSQDSIIYTLSKKTVSTQPEVSTRRSFKVYKKLKVVRMFERGLLEAWV